MAITTETIFKTTDGHTFSSREEALVHEAGCIRKQKLADYVRREIHYSGMTSDDLIDALLVHAASCARILEGKEP